MPRITISEGIAYNPSYILTTLPSLVAGSTVVSGTAIQAELMVGASPVTIDGTGLSYTPLGAGMALTGGTIETVHIDFQNLSGYDIDVTGLSLDVAALQAAASSEMAGDFRALDRLLFTQDWEYYGNSIPERFPLGATDANGVVLNLRGDDLFVVEFGDDTIWSGHGADTLFGGLGEDWFHGGRGDDRLIGQGNDDVLYGAAGLDRLIGGGGHDLLSGGADDDMLLGGNGDDTALGGDGSDTIAGGLGDDRIKGGADADTFLFEPGDGFDRIVDFDVTQDALHLVGASGYTLSPVAAGTLVDVDGGNGQILLVGVPLGDLDPGDVVLA